MLTHAWKTTEAFINFVIYNKKPTYTFNKKIHANNYIRATHSPSQ